MWASALESSMALARAEEEHLSTDPLMLYQRGLAQSHRGELLSLQTLAAARDGRARRCACCRRTIDRRPEHDLEAGTTICPREHFGLAWPRRTHGEAIVTLNALGNGPADVAINLVESTNNGTTWTDVSPAQHFTALGATMGGAVHFVTATALLPPSDHAAGVEYMYAIRMGRVPGSTTTSDVGVLSCVLDLYNDNRNGTTSPFDDDD
jgi:hypothetical protein